MRLLSTLLLIGTLACVESLQPTPGKPLVGTWTNAVSVGAPLTLAADTKGATLSTPCWKAQFGPLRLSDSLTFDETGIVTQAGGLITLRVGDPYSLTGRVTGIDLLVNQEILTPGSAGMRVCTA